MTWLRVFRNNFFSFEKRMMAKILMAFDFDRTITVENTDYIALELLPKEDQDRLWKSCKQGQWTKFVNAMFKTLVHRNVSIDVLRKSIRKLELNEGMLELFQYIQANENLYDCIIISDCNDWFINIILEANNLKTVFKKVFTNPATIIDNELLHVAPCHSHNHISCPYNMCKGTLLQNFVKEQNIDGITYRKVYYFGDSTNDFCACETLSETDLIFPRKGFSLENKLNEIRKNDQKHIRAQVIPWKNGFDIINSLATLKQA